MGSVAQAVTANHWSLSMSRAVNRCPRVVEAPWGEHGRLMETFVFIPSVSVALSMNSHFLWTWETAPLQVIKSSPPLNVYDPHGYAMSPFS